MELEQLNPGASANDKQGDKGRDAFLKIQRNFAAIELESNNQAQALSDKVDKVPGKGLSTNDFTNEDVTALAALSQSVADLGTSKVDRVPGKGLSTNDFTDEAEAKLAGLESSRFKGLFDSLASLQAAHPVGEAGDYANVDQGVGSNVQRYLWDTSDSQWVLSSGTSTEMTPAQVKASYESNPNTNAYTDAEKARLAAMADGATNDAPVLITNGANLNTYTKPGTYYSHSIELTQSLTGKPAALDTAFVMVVLPIDPTVGTNAVYQNIYAYSSVKRWGRVLSSGGSTAWDLTYSEFSPPPLATPTAAGLMSAADKAKLDEGVGGKGQLFAYDWHNGPRSSIDSGCIPADGQVLQFADNPVVCQAIWDGKQNAVLDANWAANKNCWSRGDGATWVRVPNLNMADGSAKPFYLRGGPESLTGTWVGDAIRNLTGTMLAAHGSLVTQNNGTSGVFTADLPVSYRNPIEVGSSYSRVTLDASRSVPTADENRVKTAYGVWTVRVFTEVSNTGAIDAAQLATQLGVVDAKVQTLSTRPVVVAAANFSCVNSISIRSSYGISSITRESAGVMTVNFSTPQPNANYLVFCGGTSINGRFTRVQETAAGNSTPSLKTTTQVRLRHSLAYTDALDCSEIYVQIVRIQP